MSSAQSKSNKTKTVVIDENIFLFSFFRAKYTASMIITGMKTNTQSNKTVKYGIMYEISSSIFSKPS
jgi:hypothetical protein